MVDQERALRTLQLHFGICPRFERPLQQFVASNGQVLGLEAHAPSSVGFGHGLSFPALA
jgi:hypothetical protein